MKALLQLLLFILFALTANAQQKWVSGTVTSAADGLSIAGVNVIVKGSTAGWQTDFNGNYRIQAGETDTLVFSFISMLNQEVKVGKNSIINIVMEYDENLLEEVVVMGYGISSKSSKIRSESIVNSKILKSSLTGKSAGILIRGATNISGVNRRSSKNIIHLDKSKNQSLSDIITEPLYIVDGVAIPSHYNKLVSQFRSIDIDRVKTYKSEKAERIFGSIAKNGCVVITTVKGNYRIENDESYARITENKFERTELAPLSTFSIDVDKAAYSNIRRMLNNGQTIPVDAVKIEEMIIYFTYDYPQPNSVHPFTINTEAIKTPWNQDTKLIKIGLQGKTYKNEELPASNLTFLIDVSGSMSNINKLPLLKSAFRLLVNQLRSKDKVSIVVYAGAAGMVLEPTSGDKKTQIISALNNLHAGGSTAGGAGIELAYNIATENFIKEGNNRVILATDGDFNVGESSDVAMERLIENKRQSGIFLSVLGFGYGNLKDSKLETLADKGNGNHAYIDTMQEAQKIFGQEFGGTLFTIAKDVKIQVEFNPVNVKAYRLIGYENRLLSDEDFIDDTKDAGELGSGHSVTAIYEIIPVGNSSPYLKEMDKLKYTKPEKSLPNSDELLTIKFRYKLPNEDISKELVYIQYNKLLEASVDFKFASAVALFGMQLRNSQYLNGIPFSDILSLAREGKGIDAKGYRSEFIRLLESYQDI